MGVDVKYWGRKQESFTHETDDGIRCRISTDRAGRTFGLTATFTDKSNNHKYVFFIAMNGTKTHHFESLDEVQDANVMCPRFSEALAETFVSFMDKCREKIFVVEGRPLYVYKEWPEIELMQIATERLGKFIEELPSYQLQHDTTKTYMSRANISASALGKVLSGNAVGRRILELAGPGQ